MRSRFLLPVLTLAAVIAAGVIWLREHTAARALQDRVATLTRQEQGLTQLQVERERLRHEVQDAVRRIHHEPAAPAPAPAPVETPKPAAWVVGDWIPATAWHNAGRVTPQATTTTLLWAAANGDLAALRDVFQFDEHTRAKAGAWFGSLPPEVRSLHATPEDLVAGVTLVQIAPDRAQLSWLHEDAANNRAIVGMLVAGPASALPLPIAEAAQGDRRPPSLDDRSRYKVVVLSLQRATDGWRVHVPADAIDTLAWRLRASDTE